MTSSPTPPPQPQAGLAWDPLRVRKMIERQLVARGIHNERVLEAMATVPRSAFVPPGQDAYFDGPIPIGEGQTISQPYVVARMTELLEVEPGMSVLEIGVGSGYQTAVLAAMGAEVFGIERHGSLLEKASQSLERAGLLDRVHLHHGDGTAGWPQERQFDRMLAAAGAPEIPRKLIFRQLADGGRAVLPVGPMDLQRLMIIERQGQALRCQPSDAVRFVPLIGQEGWGPEEKE